MCTGQRFPAVLVLLILSLATARVGQAASPLAAPDGIQSRKGIVTAKAEKSLTVREGSGAFQVAVMDTTQITGLRDSFARIAVGDIVRIDGRMAQDRQLLAGRIEVLFAAGAAGAPQPQAALLGNLFAQAPVLAGLLSVLVNGGVTVQLP